MCHYQHHAHPDPLVHIGHQDITAHVNFSQVAHAAVDSGWQVAHFTNQASFLIANDLLSLLEANQGKPQYLECSQQTKLLTHPAEMGELFKVITLTKAFEFDEPLPFDWRAKL